MFFQDTDTDLLEQDDVIPTPKFNVTPVFASFCRDKSGLKGLDGAYGLGKTGLLVNVVKTYILQQNKDARGVRSTKVLVTRPTYPEIDGALLPEFRHWFEHGTYKMVGSAPRIIHIFARHEDGSIIMGKIIFMGLESDDSLQKIVGYNLDYACIDEANKTLENVWRKIYSRTRRNNKNSIYKGVMFFYNRENTSNYLYKTFYLDRSFKMEDGTTFSAHVMPAPLYRLEGEREDAYYCSEGYSYYPNPKAQGIDFQGGYGYWLNMISTMHSDYEIVTKVLNRWAPMVEGQPYYPDYEVEKHYAGQVVERQTKTIYAVFDWGHNAACTFFEITPLGQVIALEEFFGGSKGLFNLLHNEIGPALVKYKDCDFIGLGDPNAPKDALAYKSPRDEVKKLFAEYDKLIEVKQAYSNDLASRSTATNRLMRQRVGSDAYGILVSAKCPLINEGMSGSYRKKKQKGVYLDEPDKNFDGDIWSHNVNTLEYMAMEVVFVQRKETNRGRKRKSGLLAGATR